MGGDGADMADNGGLDNNINYIKYNGEILDVREIKHSALEGGWDFGNKYEVDNKELKDINVYSKKGCVKSYSDSSIVDFSHLNNLISMISRIDTRIDNSKIVREIGRLRYYYENDKIIIIEGLYNFRNIRYEVPDLMYNDKIGSIEF
jgi:hypothetical protein